MTEYFHEVSEHALILTQGIFAGKDLIRTTSHKPLAHRAIKSLDIFVTWSPILFLKQPNDERCPMIYVPGAEMAASVDIDNDKLKERLNAQCIQ